MPPGQAELVVECKAVLAVDTTEKWLHVAHCPAIFIG
jgi:hypothetical protein